MSPDGLLFTEMVTAESIPHAGAERFCSQDEAEHPLALQLGRSEPDRLAHAVEAVGTLLHCLFVHNDFGPTLVHLIPLAGLEAYRIRRRMR